MTRTSVNRKLRVVYTAIIVVLVLSGVAAFADQIPGLPPIIANAAENLYELLRDMSLLIATLAAAYLANVFQKRSTFVQSLEEEWRNIVRTKSTLFTYCEKPYPSTDDYLAAFCRLSETIDTMRIVYQNAGETRDLVGLYPYAPLHDMRRALQAIDPRVAGELSVEQRHLARDAILQSFYALRENFLEELDLEEPRHPLLISGGRRLKQSGATGRARSLQNRQARKQEKSNGQRPDVDDFLARLYANESNGASPHYSPETNGNGGTGGSGTFNPR